MRKRNRDRSTDDSGQEVLLGDGKIKLDVLNDGLGITYADPGPSKRRKKKQRNYEEEIAGVGHNVDIDCGRELNEIGEDGGVIKQDISTGGSGMDYFSPSHIARNSDGGCETNGKIAVGDAFIPQSPLSTSKKKKRRKDQKSFDRGENGRDMDGVRDENEPNGEIQSIASEILKPARSRSKGESHKKKTVRFQESPKESEEDVIHEEDVEADINFFSEDRNWVKDRARDDLIYGRFSKEEDDKIRSSVFNYIKMRGWDEKEGLQTVLHSFRTQARGCWLEIAKGLPRRPVKQINQRAIRLLGDYKRGHWSAEEVVELENLHKLHGKNWIKVGALLGRSGDLCKDKWRHVRLFPTRSTGMWSQDEFDKLCKLVRRSLNVKASISPKSRDRRQLRDDINWEWIASEMQRDPSRCSMVWYERLASPMISTKKWANTDDHLLLQRLMELGAASEEALDWDTIIDHRDGEVSMRRWQEMSRLLGKSDHASFEDKLELLAKRYAPDLLGIEEDS